ncbi:hypothetical protein [Micromonospora aurantiaca (nom. illeg.)]|uniref:hypothetical protein n=1 Tax=Micromonospora aurantiaca (nom. illeg.) TaxID=47850 RepID=UPI0033D4DC9C
MERRTRRADGGGVEQLRSGDEEESNELAGRVLSDWLAAVVDTSELRVDDLWARACVWRVGRVVDGGLSGVRPEELSAPERYGSFLCLRKIAPDAVQVRTPVQVERATGRPRRPAATEVAPRSLA